MDCRDDSYEGRTYWFLRWDDRASEMTRDHFDIGLDAGDGKMFSFSCQLDDESGLAKGNVITREEAKQAALSFIRCHHPDKLAKMVFDADHRVQGDGNNLNLVYSFRWYQEIDGIPFDGNNIYVQVDGPYRTSDQL